MPRDNSLKENQRFAIVCRMTWTGTEDYNRALFLQPLWNVLTTSMTSEILLLYELSSKGFWLAQILLSSKPLVSS